MVVSGGCIPASLQNQLGAVLQPGAKQHSVTADSLPLFPCLPKTAWAPLSSLLGADTVPSPWPGIAWEGFTGSSQHRGGRTVCGQPGALPCFVPWFRNSQEMLTCGAIPGSSRADLGNLQGPHALGFTGRVVGHFL